jgi:hypothetical protein
VAYILITAKWNWVPLTEGRQISHMSTIFGTISFHVGNGQNWEW